MGVITIPKVNIDGVLLLRDNGKTYKQIAEYYHTTDKYIRKILHEARDQEKLEKMRDNLAKANAKDSDGFVVPGTDMVITSNKYAIENAAGKIGDDKVKAFIAYHLEMMQMRQGVDKQNVQDLYARFASYLVYCMEHNIMPSNMNAYYAIGVSQGDMTQWAKGQRGTPEHQKFAEDVKAFFSSIREQGGIDGMISPILTIWWQKTYDKMIEAQKVETVEDDPMGEKQSADAIAAKWSEVQMPDD